MKVSLIQSDLQWEQPAANRESFEAKLETLYHQTDVVLLPEMFTTGFSMNADALCETMDGPSVQWMKQQAVKGDFLLAGSLIIKAEGNIYNRMILAFPDGSLLHYDKKHLFTMGDEPNHYTSGSQQLSFIYKTWNCRVVICYDIRFPIWCRNDNDYDVLFVVANWPEVRQYPWRQLLIARAIENQCYVAAVNRVGVDGNGMNHSGNSMIISPRGEILEEAVNDSCFITQELDKNILDNFRAQFPVLKDRDSFQWK